MKGRGIAAENPKDVCMAGIALSSRPSCQGRQHTGIDCLDLVEEGGTLHCISQQQPA